MNMLLICCHEKEMEKRKTFLFPLLTKMVSTLNENMTANLIDFSKVKLIYYHLATTIIRLHELITLLELDQLQH